MFATNTIYATYEWPGMKDILTSVVSGLALSFTFVAYLVRYVYGSTLHTDTNSTSESEEQEDDVEEQEENERKRAALLAFQNRYYDELEALTDQEVSVERRKELSTIILQEVTPDGEIVLSYDDNAEAFRYYSDSFLKVSYQTLDVLARKFAVLYNCKALCINARQELIFAHEKIEKDRQDTIKQLDNPQPQPQPRSIFAKFKKYDKTTTSNIKQVANLIPVPEKSNRFIYKGNLLAAKVAYLLKDPAPIETAVPEPSILETSAVAAAPVIAAPRTMDYATFKRLVLNP